MKDKLKDALNFLANNGHLEAATVLHQVLQGAEARRTAGLKPKGRSKTYDPDKVMMSAPEFGVVMQLVAGNIGMDQAMGEMAELIGIEADDKTLRSFIKAIEPRARQVVDLMRAIGFDRKIVGE